MVVNAEPILLGDLGVKTGDVAKLTGHNPFGWVIVVLVTLDQSLGCEIPDRNELWEGVTPTRPLGDLDEPPNPA